MDRGDVVGVVAAVWRRRDDDLWPPEHGRVEDTDVNVVQAYHREGECCPMDECGACDCSGCSTGCRSPGQVHMNVLLFHARIFATELLEGFSLGCRHLFKREASLIS